MDETKSTEQKKKNPLQKLKENIDDKEEQLAILGNFVRLGVLIWSGFILTLNYITIPGWQQNKIDPTFIASVFTGVLASYGVETAKKRGDGTYKSEDDKPMNKKDIQAMLQAQSQNFQTIRVETPIKLVPVEPKIDPITNKPIDPQTGKLT
tara:strand:- start:153 stop:605 length:453 start_codon:yes stop_codon:yes gene_type:complete